MQTMLSTIAATHRRFTSNVQVGIDFGTQSCKLAVAESSANHWRINSVARFEFPAGDPLASGFLRNELGKWLRELGLSRQSFACSLPNSSVNYKSIELPIHEPQQRNELVAKCVRESCGVPGPTLACDDWLTRSLANPQQFALHLSWTNSAFLSQLNKECQAAGLRCRVVNAQPYVLARMATCMNKPTSTGTLVIDLGASTGTISWVVNGEPLYVRQIRTLGTGPILHQLAAHFSMQPREVECLLAEGGLPLPGSHSSLAMLLEELLMPWLQTVQTEIARTFSYLKQCGERINPEQVILGGGLSGLRGFSEWLSTRLSFAVQAVAYPQDWEWEASVPYHPAYAGAICLATLGGPV